VWTAEEGVGARCALGYADVQLYITSTRCPYAHANQLLSSRFRVLDTSVSISKLSHSNIFLEIRFKVKKSNIWYFSRTPVFERHRPLSRCSVLGKQTPNNADTVSYRNHFKGNSLNLRSLGIVMGHCRSEMVIGLTVIIVYVYIIGFFAFRNPTHVKYVVKT